ncbi:MAG TPA: PQQ-binding-like beta-propeller repeat protein, partial [Pirellulaceae bacterium]
MATTSILPSHHKESDMYYRLAAWVPLAIAIGAWHSSFASDWNRFRGPNGSGVSPDSEATPTTWDASNNIRWRVALPGPGSSSPIIVGDRVLVTCWSGYGTDRENPGDQKDLVRHLICFDRSTGKILWDETVEAVLPEDNYGGMFAEHGYATHTPVSDGKHVFVYFGKSGALAFDMDGKRLWQTKLGTESDPRGWGSASSPILYKDFVIVTASAESEALVALNKSDGKIVWRQEASGLNSLWGTPILMEAEKGVADLVLGVPMEIWGLNPDTGKLRWFCSAM